MSDIAPQSVTCPRCQQRYGATLFTSVNGDAVPAQVAAILDGTFEQTECRRCGLPFRPDHNLLFTQMSQRAWIVMVPLAERGRFRAIEQDVEERLAAEFAQAPPLVAAALRGVRPRLVFGQHMLSEAVRVLHAGLDAALLECAKLHAVRDHLAQLLPLGPCELAFEHIVQETGALAFVVHRLDSGAPLGRLRLAPDTIAQARHTQPEMERRYPDLFQRSYVSASRYLYG